MKVVINTCFGGFGLSNKAKKRLGELMGKDIFFYKKTKYEFQEGQNEYVKVNPEEKSIFIHSVIGDLGDVINELPDDKYFADYQYDEDRSNPLLIQVIEELGKEANGQYADLKIVEIPDNVEYIIDDYDGVESIHEKHRVWD